MGGGDGGGSDGVYSVEEVITGLASLSEKFAVLDLSFFFFRCRRRSKTKIPIKASAAIPPTTTPAISPVDGPESDFDDEEFVDKLGSCVPVLPNDDTDPVAVEVVTTTLLLLLLPPSPAPVEAVISAAILVASADCAVGNAPTTLPATLSITAVGTVIPLLDSTDDTSPTILDIKLPICLRCCSWARRTCSAVMLPAARQCSFAVASMSTRSG